MFTSRQEELLKLLSEHTYVYGNPLAQAMKVSRARLNYLISRLIKEGYVISEGKARATRYRLVQKKKVKYPLLERENHLLRLRVNELEIQLEDRKIIERAKEILMAQFNIKPTEAYRKLQEQSMNRRKSMRQIAEAILGAYEI